MDITPITRVAVSDEVSAQLMSNILTGTLRPGDALPAERELADEFGVNRHAVREALKEVRRAGLVQIAHGGKTRVLNWRAHSGLDVLSMVAATGVVPPLQVLRDVAELRRTIAVDSAYLCAQRASPEQRELLLELARQYPDGGYALDAEFWTTLIDGSGNLAYRLALNTMLDGIRDIGEATFGALGFDAEIQDRSAHLELAQAISENEAERARYLTSTMLAGVIDAINELSDNTSEE